MHLKEVASKQDPLTSILHSAKYQDSISNYLFIHKLVKMIFINGNSAKSYWLQSEFRQKGPTPSEIEIYYSLRHDWPARI